MPDWAEKMLSDDTKSLHPATYCGCPDTEMSEQQLRMFLRSTMKELVALRNSPNPFR